MSSDLLAVPAPGASAAGEQLVHESDTTRVVRLAGPPAVLCKQPLGRGAGERLRRERRILEHLGGIAGVARQVAGPQPADCLVLEDAGVPLAALLKPGPLHLRRALALACSLAGVLARLHAHGVIHRDICPANILCSPADEATLLDFELAVVVGQPEADPAPREGLGRSLTYMAPEQTGRTGRTTDHRADLYAFGAVLYETVLGRPPFEHSDALGLMHGHLVEVPAAPAAVDPRLPPALSALILRLLEKEPGQRYQSAEGVASDLARILQAVQAGAECSFELGQHDFGARLLPPALPVGRHAEIAALGAVLELSPEVMESCVLLSGAAGSGKTALVRHLRRLVAQRQGWFVSTTFHQHRRDAFAAGAPLRALGRLLLAEPEEQLTVYRQRMLQAVGRNLGVGPTRLPEFELLLGKHPRVPMSDPREAETRINQATLDLLGSVGTPERPVVMVLEDLQWAPSISFAFLDAVVSAPERLPGFLLVGTYRVAEDEPGHALHELFARWRALRVMPAQLEVRNLALAGFGQLVAGMLRQTPAQSRALAEALFERTAGNPQDAVELVNALRHEGLLRRQDGGWQWNASEVRAYVGECSVPSLLARRVARLPPPTLAVLRCIACLGGGVRPAVLEVATGLSADALQQRVAAAVEDGVLVPQDPGLEPLLRFRHARVQEAVLAAMDDAARMALHLEMARRLVQDPRFEEAAAEQYLPAAAGITPGERQRVVELFEAAAGVAGALSLKISERYLDAAIRLLDEAADPACASTLLRLLVSRHQVLYAMGRLQQADEVYAAIVSRSGDPLLHVQPAGVQIYSLSNRGRYREALDMGLGLLAELGLERPATYREGVREGLRRVARWVAGAERMADYERPFIDSPRQLALASLLTTSLTPAYFCDPATLGWLALEGHAMWDSHGPCDELVSVACTAASLLAGAAQDYRGAHAGTSHVIAVGEARGLVTGTAAARLTHSLSVAHWRDPIETALALFRRTREDLLRLGNTRTASYTYVASDLLLDCAPTLHEAVAEVDAGLALAAGVASEDYTRRYLPRRQLLRALRGTTHAPGGFSDDEFDEAAYVQQLAGADTTSATYHITATITAAIFGDRPAWARHAAAAMPMQARTPGYYLTAVLRTLHAVSLAEACRYLPLEERSTQLGEIDTHAQWLRGRAADAAQNFAHLLAWVEAERAWSAGSVWETGAGFDRARASAAEHRRPWHAALITERAAYFHMEQGLETSGRLLLAEARDRYDAWGAEGKVRELERAHPVLRARTTPREQGGRRGPERAATGWEAIDLMAVIRASQSLSSETNLAQLQDRVTQVLSAITGATHVQLALWQEDAGGWMLPAPAAEDAAAASIPLAEAAARGLVPVTAFRYAERTRQALLVEDACRDDRFSEDPYLRGLERCSLLLVPILSQGAQRAMLLLENRLGAKAFSAERLDAVTLIAGQLAVSLENALLYRELEQRVQERTQQLRRAQAELVGTARRAGMAEIATNVLHNVGNVLNSVNVSADLAAARLRSSRAKGLARAAEMLRAHTHDLAAFLTTDDKGRLLPAYLVTVSDAIAAEQREILEELGNLTRSVGHIKDVVATQQSHAGASSLIERADLTVLVEDALRINSILLERAQVRVVREFEAVPPADLDKTRVMQILVNLVRNAVQAMESSPTARALTVTLGRAGDATRVAITDSGVGIPADNITRIFAHGFTTRDGGHGFGLHSCALAAREMGGTLEATSPGAGQGATFTLALPVASAG